MPELNHEAFMAALEHAPKTCVVAEGLVGVRFHDGRVYCATCTNRVLARGFSNSFPDSCTFVWLPEQIEECMACSTKSRSTT